MKTHFLRNGLIASVISSFLLTAGDASACATCFGQTDSPLGRGLNWGIFALLVVVNCVLAGICSFFVYVARRSAKLEAEDKAIRESGGVGASKVDERVGV